MPTGGRQYVLSALDLNPQVLNDSLIALVYEQERPFATDDKDSAKLSFRPASFIPIRYGSLASM